MCGSIISFPIYKCVVKSEAIFIHYNESRILKCVHKIFTSDLSNFMIFSAFKSVSRVVYFIVIINFFQVL